MFEMRELIKLAFAVIFPYVGAIWGADIAIENMDPWYNSLVHPTWSPPDWSNAPIWTAIFCSIGIASYLVLKEVTVSGRGWDLDARVALVLYIAQMILNWAWVPILYGLHSLRWVCALTLSQLRQVDNFYHVV